MDRTNESEAEKPSFDGKGIAALAIRILLSLLFFYTAIAKLRPIEPFEFTIVESGWVGWDGAWFLARLIIGIEFALGALLLLGVQQKTTLRIGAVFLTLLSIHLISLLATVGNISDCGCMGAEASITPLNSLLKNLGILALFALLWRWKGRGFEFPFFPRTIFTSFGILAILLPFILFPPASVYQMIHGEAPEPGIPFKIEELKELEERKGISWKGEERIVGFLSTNCPYCQMAARKLSIMDERIPDELPVHLFFHGDAESLEEFREESRMKDFPSSFLPLKRIFHFAGNRVPAFYLVDGDRVRERMSLRDLSEEKVRALLKGTQGSKDQEAEAFR